MNEIPQQPTTAPIAAPVPPAFPAVPPPPPARNRRGLKIAGTVLAMAAGLVIGKLAMGAVLGSDAPEDAGRYELVPPAAFQGLTLQESGPRVDAIKAGQGPAKPGVRQVAVVYADASGTAQLVVSGAAGTFQDRDPGAELTAGLKGMGAKEAEITEHEAGKPAGGAMRCATVTFRGTPVPMCMWADHSALVTVSVPVENKPVPMDELAERARALRGAMEVPAS
ncbi:hypothetical protein [Streptomyces sp. NPDC002054]|uniref:hypothetical protein n=1 Tax=Streptomyces sp. NPDC002054 TaxID=3154663 RepID=UPI00331AB55B